MHQLPYILAPAECVLVFPYRYVQAYSPYYVIH